MKKSKLLLVFPLIFSLCSCETNGYKNFKAFVEHVDLFSILERFQDFSQSKNIPQNNGVYAYKAKLAYKMDMDDPSVGYNVYQYQRFTTYIEDMDYLISKIREDNVKEVSEITDFGNEIYGLTYSLQRYDLYFLKDKSAIAALLTNNFHYAWKYYSLSEGMDDIFSYFDNLESDEDHPLIYSKTRALPFVDEYLR